MNILNDYGGNSPFVGESSFGVVFDVAIFEFIAFRVGESGDLYNQ